LSKGRRRISETGFTRIRQNSLPKPAIAGLQGAHAKVGNLMGFLDAFKAVAWRCELAPTPPNPCH
jgi:hypothetical protein